MLTYKCDGCEKTMERAFISLEVRSQFSVANHFCSDICFVKYVFQNFSEAKKLVQRSSESSGPSVVSMS